MHYKKNKMKSQDIDQKKKRIVVIEDNEKTILLLRDYLTQFEYEVIAFTNPFEGIRNIETKLPDLIILDIMLPEMDGFEVCRTIRKNFTVPIIMLTARGDVTDRIVGLELGADDYLPKPFEPRELLARIQTVLRRGLSKTVGIEGHRLGRLVIFKEKQLVKLDDETLNLTTYEFELLMLFVRKPGMLLTREYIINSLKGIDWSVFDRSVDTLISRLRQKLKDDPRSPEFIKTVWGSGYKFIGDEA
jgi:DNA-binding response OmpR family regulator